MDFENCKIKEKNLKKKDKTRKCRKSWSQKQQMVDNKTIDPVYIAGGFV